MYIARDSLSPSLYHYAIFRLVFGETSAKVELFAARGVERTRRCFVRSFMQFGITYIRTKNVPVLPQTAYTNNTNSAAVSR